MSRAEAATDKQKQCLRCSIGCDGIKIMHIKIVIIHMKFFPFSKSYHHCHITIISIKPSAIIIDIVVIIIIMVGSVV